MLTDSERTIVEIALAMGCSDAAHIARYFSSLTGMSLAEYRRQYCPKYQPHRSGAPGQS